MEGQAIAGSLKKQAEDLRSRQATLAQKERELAARERELERSALSISEKEKALAESEERVARKAADAESARAEISREKAALRDRSDAVALKEAEAEEARAHASELLASLKAREADVEARHAELIKREARLAEEERQSKARLSDIVRRHAETESPEGGENELIARRAKELDAVFDSLGGIRTDLDALRKTLSGKADEMSRKEKELLERERELAGHIEETARTRDSILARERELIALQSELKSIVHGEPGTHEGQDASLPDSGSQKGETPEPRAGEEGPAGKQEAPGDDIMRKSKQELVDMAKGMGLPSGGKKEDIARRIMAFRDSPEREAKPEGTPSEAPQERDGKPEERTAVQTVSGLTEAAKPEIEETAEPLKTEAPAAANDASPAPDSGAGFEPTEDLVKEVIREAQASIAKAYNEGIDISSLKPLLKEAKELARATDYYGAFYRATECRDRALQLIEGKHR